VNEETTHGTSILNAACMPTQHVGCQCQYSYHPSHLRAFFACLSQVGDSVFVHAGLVREHLRFVQLGLQLPAGGAEHAEHRDGNGKAGSSSNGLGRWAAAEAEARAAAAACGKSTATVVSIRRCVCIPRNVFEARYDKSSLSCFSYNSELRGVFRDGPFR
jgi:hypothetical protein